MWWKKILFALKLLAILVLTTILAVLLQIWSHKTVGEGIAGRAEKFERILEKPKGNILFAGDSTAFGTGVSAPEYSTAGRLGTDYQDYTIRNISKNGLELDEFAKSMRAEEGEYDLVVMQIGANDVLRIHSFSELEKDARDAVGAAKEKSDNVIWLAVGNIGTTRFFPWPVSRFYDFWSNRARFIFMSIAHKEGVHYIDLYKQKNDKSYNPEGIDIYSRDGLHLNDFGYSIWYNEIKKVIDKNLLLVIP